MPDAEVVEATILDEALVSTTGLDALVADMTARASALAESYVPHEIVGADDYRQSKRARSSARKDIAKLRADYDAAMRPIKELLADADARVRAAMGPLDEVDAGYKSSIDAWEDGLRSERLAELQATYDDYAPDLVPLVPLDRLVDRYGNEKGSKWLLQGTNVEKAKRMLCEAVDLVAQGERTVEWAVGEDGLDEAKADFFATLDAAGAIEAAKARQARREEVRRLEEAREERGSSVMTPEEFAQAWSDTAPDMPVPREIMRHVAEGVARPEAGEVPPYVMATYGQLADKNAFVTFCEGRALKPKTLPTNGDRWVLRRK